MLRCRRAAAPTPATMAASPSTNSLPLSGPLWTAARTRRSPDHRFHRMFVSPPTRRQILSDSWRRLAEILPEVRRPWFLALMLGAVPLVTAICLLLGVKLARVLPGGAPVVEALCVIWMGLFMYAGFWQHRIAYRQRYGMDA